MLNAVIIFILFASAVLAEQVAVVYVSDPTGINNVTGNITFTKTDAGILVVGVVVGLETGNHGFHIHNLGKIFPDCMESGAHFNPENYTHGAPNETVRHVGDLGNIFAQESGIANINIIDTVIDLEGSHNIIGRALVVHEGEDDLGKGGNDSSLTTGNAGGRLACGVIGILEEERSSGSVLAVNLLINVLVFFAAYGLKSMLSF